MLGAATYRWGAVSLGLALFGTFGVKAQTTGTSPVLAQPYATKSTAVFVKVEPFPSGEMPHAPAGFRVSRFAANLDSPRNTYVLPNGDVLVAEAKTERKYNDPQYRDAGANRISLLRDTNGDGVADQRTTYLANLRQPYGMTLIGRRLYVADTDGIFWVPYVPGAASIPDSVKRVQIARFDPGGYNNHWTRNIVASRDGRYLYVAIGSASNAGEDGVEEENRRANILRIDLENENKESVYAWGIRNPVGMDLDPGSGKLWAAVNERDELGDDIVPDYIVQPKQGGFYGWPWFYWGKHEDPRLAGQRPDLKPHVLTPDYAMGAHVAATGIGFGAATKFPADWRGGAFVTRHGSWNRSVLAGYDVVFVPFEAGHPTGPLRPFLTGFTKSNTVVYGRPRAVTTAKDGSLLICDDVGGTIWQVSYQGARR